MRKFLEKCNLPKLTQDEIEDLNSPLGVTLGPDVFIGELYATLKEEIQRSYKIFQKIENTWNTAYGARGIILIPNPNRGCCKKERKL